ncbi:MAG: tetratricopeptide repeat protein [Thermoguttaceae bacterium]
MRPVFSLLFLLVAAVISGEASTRPVSSPDDAAMIRIAVADALRSGEFDRADKLLHDPKIANSNNWKDQVWRGEALNILGRHAWREGRIAEAEARLGDAEAAFRRAIELNDQAAEAYVSLVEFFSALGQKKFNNKAREVLARARAHLPPNESHWALAKMYDALKEKDNARKEYEVALAAAPDDSTSIRNLADFHLRNQGVAAATPLLTKILELKGKAKPQDVIWARRQLALLTASQGGYPNLLKARMMIEENLASGELAAEDLRAKATFLALDPRRAKRMEATEALETLLRHPDLGTLEDRYTLAQVYLALGNMRKFRKHMRPLLAKDPPDLRFIRTYIAAELESNELAEVEIWLSTLERVAPDWIDTVRFRADDLVRRDRPDEALALLRRFAERPDASPARLLEDQHSLVEIFEQLANRLSESQKPERTATGKRFLKEAEQLCRLYVEQRPEEAMLLAGFLVRHDRAEEALKLMEEQWSLCKAEAVAKAVDALVAKNKLAADQNARVEKILQGALKESHRALPLVSVYAGFAALQKNYAEAESCYREVIAKEPNNAAALNNLAMLFVAQGIKLDEALETVNGAIEYWPATCKLDTRAMVRLAKNEPENALADVNVALGDGDNPVYLFHLAEIYDRLGRKSEAAEALGRARKSGLKESALGPYERPVYERLDKELR